MNTEHRYIFEKGSKKHRCRNCDKKRFVRYIDTQTGEYLPDQYGRCDRESKCGYLLNPYKDGYAKAIWEQEQGNKTDWKPQQPKRIKKPVNKPKRVFIPVEVFNRTRAGYEQNTFIQNLLARVAFPFEVQDIEKVISLYHLGTVQNGYRAGANTFPFIDVQGNVRAVQVKQFDEQNHTTGTDFLHSIIDKHLTRNNKPLPEWLEAYNKNETKVSCLFGEHLLSKHPYNPVALVEAPKTAIYGTLYFGFPEQPTKLLWLAVYNLSSLNLNKCKALKGRNVYLFPDLSKDGKAFESWSSKAAKIQRRLQGTYFHVSDLLERLAPQQDKEQGKDIADYLIKQDWRLFRKQETDVKVKVVNIYKEPHDLYIGRENKRKKLPASKWANPFSVKQYGREKAISLFREYITKGNGKHLLNDLHELQGKTLGCYCKPQSCHGDVLKELCEMQPEPAETSTREKSEKSEALKKTFFSQPEPLPKVEVFQPEPIREQPQNWSNDIAELESYFANIELPTQPVKLNKCSTITDCCLFIESHFATVKANNGKQTFLPHLNRLNELKEILT